MSRDTSRPLRASAGRTIILGGSLAGLLDILHPLILTWLDGGAPIRVLHTIASGLIGRAAYSGGAATAALGLALHFLIACAAATTFLMVSRLWPWLLRLPLVAGPVFGLLVWAFMYQVVLPITFDRPWTMPPLGALANQLGIHVLGVGLPIALVASRSARRHQASVM